MDYIGKQIWAQHLCFHETEFAAICLFNSIKFVFSDVKDCRGWRLLDEISLQWPLFVFQIAERGTFSGITGIIVRRLI